VTREGESAELTQIGITMGTPLYMSPEQVEGKPLDPRSDIYSLGVTCYHMLTGTPPFIGETALGVAVQHLKKDAKPLESIRPDLPPGLCRLVHQMLAKSPDQRPQSARDLLRELRRLQLEHCGDSWPEDLPGWESLGIELSDDTRYRTTQQLDGLMKTIALERPSRYAWLWLSAGIVTAFLVGTLAAWLSIAQAEKIKENTKITIPKQSTVLRQWYFASRVALEQPDSAEEAWQSMIEYYPDQHHYVHRAQQQLAFLYLRERDYEQAAKIFQLFSRESKDELIAFGLAGEAAVFTLEGKYHDAAKELEALWPLREKLQHAEMQKLLDRVIKKVGENVGLTSTHNWDKWLNEVFGEKD
jgi:eukaryotic-like serine/threonine-protein kinase